MSAFLARSRGACALAAVARSTLHPLTPLFITLLPIILLAAHAQQAQAQTPPTATLAPIQVQTTAETRLSAPSLAQARQRMEQIPGGAALVAESAWRATQAATIKDVLDYTPGVFAQPKWGEDARLAIRGSGLSRYYHTRGIALYQDGVPLNNADGSSDLQWVDPSAYHYAEVYKGANALRYGAGTLGGAVNFVTATGHDADRFQGRVDLGSFGWRRVQSSAGFAGERVDGFITGSWQRQDGYRDHSGGNSVRVNGNLGLRLSDQAETRFYLSAARIRQEIPGSLTRDQALHDPRRAAPQNLANDWQRNIDGARIANRTVLAAGANQYEVGVWYAQNHLRHPIFQYLDNDYADYGAHARLNNTSTLAGHGNRLSLGLTWSAGKVDASNHVNSAGRKGTLLSRTDDSADNLTLYGENAFDVVPGLSLIAGMQYLHAERKRSDRYNGGLPTIRSGSKSYDFFNPKLGLLWQAAPGVQVYGNLSRSGEAPTFGDMNFASANDLDRLKPQRATTVEIGTRGQSRDFGWDLSLYRARVSNEFQCISTAWNICDQTTNLDRTIHQGMELGLHWTALKGVFMQGPDADSIRLQGAYTFNDFRFDDDPNWGNNRIPGVPRHYLRAEARYQHPAGFYLGPNIEWVPQAYHADNANSMQTASYVLFGMRAGWERGPLTWYIEGRNLGNRKYIASASITDRAQAGNALFEPGMGQAIFAGLQVRY